MAYPTRLQIQTRFLALLDDPAGRVFTAPVFTEAFGEAYDALYQAFLNAQVPRIELIQPVTVSIGTTQMTPADMGITDFGDFIYLQERTAGSSDRYTNLTALDDLTQRAPTDRLMEFVWRNNTFYFIGATSIRDVLVKYDTSGVAPTADTAVIGVDSSLTFLSNYAAGVAGGRKGYEDVATRCMNLAVGPKYNLGTIGGALFMLTQNLVRSRQKVPIAPRPFRAGRGRGRYPYAVPYVAAQGGTTGGGVTNVPVQYSTADGTIVGSVDGSNSVFTIIVGVSGATVYWNGLEQIEGVIYLRVNNQITFFPGNIPQPGDTVTATAWPVRQ